MATDREQSVWNALVREFFKSTSGVQFMSPELSFSLARAEFFDEREIALTPDGAALAARIAGTLRDLRRVVRITVRLEDAAAIGADPDRIANGRAEALRATFASAGARCKLLVHTAAFEGDYDGSPDLDPSNGRVDFALIADDGRVLQGDADNPPR